MKKTSPPFTDWDHNNHFNSNHIYFFFQSICKPRGAKFSMGVTRHSVRGTPKQNGYQAAALNNR